MSAEAEALFARLVATGCEPQKQDYWDEHSGWDLESLGLDISHAGLGLGLGSRSVVSSRALRQSDPSDQHIWRMCRRGDRSAVRTLLDSGVHVDCADDYGVTPLMVCLGLGLGLGLELGLGLGLGLGVGLGLQLGFWFWFGCPSTAPTPTE